MHKTLSSSADFEYLLRDADGATQATVSPPLVTDKGGRRPSCHRFDTLLIPPSDDPKRPPSSAPSLSSLFANPKQKGVTAEASASDAFQQCLFRVDPTPDDADADEGNKTAMERKYDQLCKEHAELRKYSMHLYCETMMLYYLSGRMTATDASLSECVYTQFELMQDIVAGHPCEAKFDECMTALRAENDRELAEGGDKPAEGEGAGDA